MAPAPAVRKRLAAQGAMGVSPMHGVSTFQVWQIMIIDRPPFLGKSSPRARPPEVFMPDDLKDSILSMLEASLDAQLPAVRRERNG